MRPTRTTLPTLAVVAALITMTACGNPTPQEAIVTSDAERRVMTIAQATAVPDVVAATERFGLTLLASAPTDTNAVVSPASAVIALSMLAEGAKGQTAKQFDVALGASGADRTDTINALITALAEFGGDPAVVQNKELPEKPLLHVANQVVIDDQIEPFPSFLDSLATGYGAGIAHVDLGGDKGKALLDAWVKENTGGLIEESAIEPDPDLRLVLQNAIVLAAQWAVPFDQNATGLRPFTLGSGAQIEADAMAQMADFVYAESDGWQAVRLPYNEGFHADVLLPPVGTDPAALTAEVKAALAAALDGAQATMVEVIMPILDIKTEPLNLQPALEDAGLGDLFVAPDLGGISDLDLYLSQAFQQATLAVDEAGTIAAAVTELGMAEMSAPMPGRTMKVDRPYVLSIAHTDTAWPMFVAAIRDPRP